MVDMCTVSELKDGRTAKACFAEAVVETGARSRSRVDWAGANSIGPRILDVGCSDGLIPIRLTRQGYSVRGIEVQVDMIDELNETAERVLADLSYRPEFDVAKISSWVSPEGRYDTVLVGQLLMRAAEPAILLSKASDCVRPGGRLIILVPWGVSPGAEQRNVYFLTDVLSLVPDEFSVVHIDIVDGEIRLIAQRLTVDAASSGLRPTEGELLKLTQRAALESQQLQSVSMMRQSAQLQQLWWRLQEANREDHGAATKESRAMLWDPEDHVAPFN